MCKQIKKRFAVLIISLMLLFSSGCASTGRLIVDMKSDLSGGLYRTINVYTANGELMATYTGWIDLDQADGYVKFDYNGKRYIYYNCFVETIADI